MKKKVVAFVPIKLNSQRLANKNILPIGNKPLCWHITDSLSRVENIDEIYVYCSNEIIKKYIPKNIKFLKRDSKLDGDLVKGLEIYDSFINEIDADIYILAHTTSPFIKSETIESALNKILFEDFDSAFSAQKIQTFAWYENRPLNYNLEDIPRTQDIRPLFVETSGFYMFYKDMYSHYRRRIGIKPYIKEVDSFEAIDIDTKDDYEFAKKIMENYKERE